MSGGLRAGPWDAPNRYQLTRILGEGGQGRVWHALDEHHSWVVVKQLNTRELGASHYTGQLLSGVVARVPRDNHLLASVITAFEGSIPHERDEERWVNPERALYVVSRWVPGVTLDIYVKRHPGDVGPLATVARAAQALHDVGLVHNDIKPGNIVVDDGSPPTGRLIDLENCRRVGDHPARVVGTRPFADESVVKRGVSPGTDGYSLARCVVFCALGSERAADTDLVSLEADLAARGGREIAGRVIAALRHEMPEDAAIDEWFAGLIEWSPEGTSSEGPSGPGWTDHTAPALGRETTSPHADDDGSFEEDGRGADDGPTEPMGRGANPTRTNPLPPTEEQPITSVQDGDATVAEALADRPPAGTTSPGGSSALTHAPRMFIESCLESLCEDHQFIMWLLTSMVTGLLVGAFAALYVWGAGS